MPICATALKTTLEPEQKLVGPPALTTGVGTAFTVTTIGDDVDVHDSAFVISTVYEPETEAVKELFVAPDIIVPLLLH